MNRNLLITGMVACSIVLGGIIGVPGANAYDCANKEVTTKTTSLAYSSSYESPSQKTTVEMRLKKIINQMNADQISRAQTAVYAIQQNVDQDHPQYWVFDMIDMLFADRLEQLENTSTIVDLAVATPSLSSLVAVVQELDLVETLGSEGPFTVFAPTNDAFERLLAQLGMTFEELASNESLLRTVVLYHVLDSEVLSTDVASLQNGTLVPTLAGESVRTSNRNGVAIDNANVIQADIDASNGVVHVIDEVLLPPSVLESLGLPTDRGENDLVTVAVESEQFPTLVAALQAADLVGALQAQGPFTVYAPTEGAFSALLDELNMTATELLADTELLTSVLTYHVVPGFYDSSDVLSIDGSVQLPTLNGETLTISNTDSGVMVNNATIVTTDIYGSNGVIHVIDSVLVPTS